MPEPHVPPLTSHPDVAPLTRSPYPRWLWLALLPWAPITAILFFFTVPRSYALTCKNGECTFELHQGLSANKWPIKDVRVEPDRDTKRPVLVVDSRGLDHFDLGPEVQPTFDAYQSAKSAKAASTVPIPNTRWWWLLNIIGTVELALVVWLARGRKPTPAG